jgi:hypothetical protein
VSTLFLPAASRNTDFDVQPFRVNLAHEVPHMKALIQNTRLPGTTLYPAADIEFDIRLDFLRDLQMKWLNEFDWTKQEATLNKYDIRTFSIGSNNSIAIEFPSSPQ